MSYDKRPPRVSIVRKQFETAYGHLLYILDGSRRINSSTQEQLWDIYRLLTDMQSSISNRLGEPPADIQEHNSTTSEIRAVFNSLMKQHEEKMKSEKHSTNRVIERVTTITEREEVSNISESNEHIVSDTVVEQQAAHTATVTKRRFTAEYSKGYKRECTLLLNKMCKYNYVSEDAKNIVQLMNRWYNLRFNTQYKLGKYTYGVNQITEGLYTILLTYAEHRVQNTVATLQADFDKWADSLETQPEAAKSWTMPAPLNSTMNDIHNGNYRDLTVYPQTLILWWSIIEPFKSDIAKIFAKYDVFIDPDFFDNMAYCDEHETTLTNAEAMCSDRHVTYSTLVSCNLD
jgi:hypothetical protein